MNREEFAKQGLIILISALVLGLSLAFGEIEKTLVYSGIMLLVILVNVTAKKLAAEHYESDLEIKFWETQRYGIREHQKFNKPIPMPWLPLFLSLITRGHFVWLNILEFDIKPKVERVVKRHSKNFMIKNYIELTEWEVAWIASLGIFANLIFAVLGYFADWTMFSQMNFFYAIFNILPIGHLDGTLIFFGHKKLWTFMIIVLGITALWMMLVF
jgi:hypothetical protein